MNRHIAPALCACLLAALLMGCGGAQQPAASPETVVLPDEIPAAQETPAPTPALSGSLSIVGSPAVGPLVVELSQSFSQVYPGVTFDIVQAGSAAGIVSAENGSADIGLSSRTLQEGEDALIQQILCYDAVAVVVNAQSSVKALSREQITEIFNGTIANWSEVGGGNGPINPKIPQMAADSRALLEETLLGEGKQFNDAACSVFSKEEDIIKAVEADANAIGILPLGLVADTALVAASVDGKEATAENVAAGAYPLARPFLLLSAQSRSELAAAFLEYVRTDSAAKELIAARGYILGQ